MIIGQQADLAAVDADRLLADARPERHAPALAGVRRPWAERLPAARLLGHHVAAEDRLVRDHRLLLPPDLHQLVGLNHLHRHVAAQAGRIWGKS